MSPFKNALNKAKNFLHKNFVAPSQRVKEHNKKSDALNKANLQSGKMQRGEAYAVPQSFKKGGIVKKTGLAKVHKGEKVLTVKQAKAAALKKKKC